VVEKHDIGKKEARVQHRQPWYKTGGVQVVE
jgi:hypothetical protein